MDDISLRQIQINELLSVRSYNVCLNAGLETLYDVLSFFITEGSFLKIRCCGRNSNIELVRLCLKFLKNIDIDSNSEGWDLKRINDDMRLSAKAIHFCELHNFPDLKTILNHYFAHGTFLNLYCTIQVDNELSRFCIESLDLKLSNLLEHSENQVASDSSDQLNNKIDEEPVEVKIFNVDISLKELTEIESLSVRSRNVLSYSKLKSINKILLHFHHYGSFKNLRNVGNKTDIELIGLALRYDNLLKTSVEANNKNCNNSPNPDLKFKSHLIGRKLLEKYKFSPFTIEQLVPEIISKNISLPRLLELFIFKESYFSQREKDIFNLIVNDVGTLESIGERNGITRERARQIKIAYEKKLYGKLSILNPFLSDARDFCKWENLILTKNYIIVNSSFFKSIKEVNEEVNDQIVLLAIKLLNMNYTFYKRGIKLAVSSYKGLNLSIYSKNNLLKNDYLLSNDLEAFYLVRLLEYVLRIICTKHREDYIVENKDLLSAGVVGYKAQYQLLQKNLSQIENRFNTESNRLWSGLISSSFSLLEGKRTKGIKSQDGYILLQKGERITLGFINNLDLNTINNWDWTSDRTINKSLLELATNFHIKVSSLKSSHEQKKIELISDLNEKYSPYLEMIDNILYAEYGLIRSGNIIIPKNTPERKPDIIYKILKERGQPMHITELYIEFNKRAPGRISDINSLRGSIGLVPNLITFGRSSTYGLKEWEKEKNIRGGTIRNLVKEYLEMFDTPMHINDIIKYINKFRCTTTSSVITNLKLMRKNTFIYYDGGYVGLKSKGKMYINNVSKISSGAQISVDELLNNIFG